MPLKPILLSNAELKSNYEYWMKKFTSAVNPDDLILNYIKTKVGTTHSFPFIKGTPDGEVIPYETIFSDTLNNGILSNGFRKANKINPDDDKSSRNIPAGLENYVFSYLGIHQPYYARKEDDKIGLYAKPFGIFIKSPESDLTTEKFPHNHASRRDISVINEEVDQKAVSLEYLLPNDARLLIAYQICNDKDHIVSADQLDSFWHYYGSMKFWKDKNYATNSWKKKAEFRFFEKLDISKVSAILWPIWLERAGGTDEAYSRTHDDFQIYSKKYPDIKFITYDLDLRDPERCFVEASYVALAFFLKYNKFPEDIPIAKNVLDI